MHLNDSLRELTANMFVAYSVILKQSPGSNGILEGYGYYAPGSEVTIVATPKERYRFVDWQKDEASVTTDSIYTFTMGEINVTYTATFEELLNAVKVTEMKDIRIYPNPNTGDFRITGLNAQCLVEIYGLSGKRLYSRTVCENYMVIKSGLPVGIYLLKITQSGNTLTMKLVIE